MIWGTKKYTGDNRIDGKTVLITGGNTGIGRETAKELYKRGARVLILSRNKEKTKNAIQQIKNECKNCANVGMLVFKELNLNELASVRKCAKEILQEEDQINILINNAGVMGVVDRYTKDGFESHFGINHLAHFLLTMLLLPRIIKSGPARIINVSSNAHNIFGFGGQIFFEDIHFKNKKYNNAHAYGQSKLANIMFTSELARKLQEVGVTNVTAYSLHPGSVKTELGRNFDQFMWGLNWLYNHVVCWFLMTPTQGAQTTNYCTLDENLATETGKYYSNCAEAKPSHWAFNDEALQKLWNISVESVKLDSSYNPFDVKCDN